MTSLQLKFRWLHEVCDVSKICISPGQRHRKCLPPWGLPWKIVTWSYTMNQCILGNPHWQKTISIHIYTLAYFTYPPTVMNTVYFFSVRNKFLLVTGMGNGSLDLHFLCHEIEQWPRAAGDLLYIGDEIQPRQIRPDYFMSHASY